MRIEQNIAVVLAHSVLHFAREQWQQEFPVIGWSDPKLCTPEAPPQTPIQTQTAQTQEAINAAAPETARQYGANLSTYTNANSQAFWDSIMGTAAFAGTPAIAAQDAIAAQGAVAATEGHWENIPHSFGQRRWVEGTPGTAATGAVAAVPAQAAVAARAAQPGLLKLFTEQVAPAMSASQNAANMAQTENDLNRVQRYGPQFMAALKASDPAKAAMIDRYNKQVGGLDLNGGLTDWQRQQYQENARGAQAARGFGYGQNDAAGEAYYMGNQQNERMLQNLGLTQNAIGINQAAYGDPFLQITGRQSGSTNAGQNLIGQGQQQGAISSGQLQSSLNPFNSYAQDYYNTSYNAQAASNIADANNKSGIIGGLLSV